MTPNKKIALLGRQFTVSGSPHDDYFRALPEGEFSDPVLSGIGPHLGDRAVCIDVGANIGLYSLALSTLAPNGRVYAFEPSREAFGYLKQNLEQNRVDNVSVSQLALGDSEQNVRFHEIPFFTAGSFAVDEGSFLTSDILGSTYFEAPCTTLDAFVRSEGIGHIDLVKVDVEGGELAVIEGSLETLEKMRPMVLLEFSSFALTLHQSTLPHVALERLKKLFPYIFVVGRNDGLLRRVASGVETYDFLYDNGIYGPVDNLVCSYDDLGVTGGYVRLTTLAAQAQEAEAARVPEEANASPAPPAAVDGGVGPYVSAARSLVSRARSRLSRVRQRSP